MDAKWFYIITSLTIQAVITDHTQGNTNISSMRIGASPMAIITRLFSRMTSMHIQSLITFISAIVLSVTNEWFEYTFSTVTIYISPLTICDTVWLWLITFVFIVWSAIAVPSLGMSITLVLYWNWHLVWHWFGARTGQPGSSCPSSQSGIPSYLYFSWIHCFRFPHLNCDEEPVIEGHPFSSIFINMIILDIESFNNCKWNLSKNTIWTDYSLRKWKFEKQNKTKKNDWVLKIEIFRNWLFLKDKFLKWDPLNVEVFKILMHQQHLITPWVKWTLWAQINLEKQ